MILLTKTDCASIQICKANLMLYQLVSIVMPQIGGPIYKPLFEVVAFTKILRVMLATHGGQPLRSLMYQVEISSTAHSSNSFRKSMLSTNTCNIENNVYHYKEKCHQKLYIPNKYMYFFHSDNDIYSVYIFIYYVFQ